MKDKERKSYINTINTLRRLALNIRGVIDAVDNDNCERVISMLENDGWIPVTERLPKEGERVLATHLGGLNPNRQVIEHIYENGRFTCGWYMDLDITSPTFGQKYMGDVIAWMPLPKPYEGSDKE